VLAGKCEADDLLARYGGEKLAILLPDTSLENASTVAERLRARIAGSEIRHNDIIFSIAISIGVAPAMCDEMLETHIGKADKALYRMELIRLGYSRKKGFFAEAALELYFVVLDK